MESLIHFKDWANTESIPRIVTHIGFCFGVDWLMYKIKFLSSPMFIFMGFLASTWSPSPYLLLSKWICSCLMTLGLLQKASDIEDIPKASLMSKIITGSEGFPTLFTFMGPSSRKVSLLCSVMGLGFILKDFSSWGYSEGFLKFGHAGA